MVEQILFNCTRHLQVNCRVRDISYKCRTNVQTSSLAFHGVILNPTNTKSRKFRFIGFPDYGRSKGLGPPAHEQFTGLKLFQF